MPIVCLCVCVYVCVFSSVAMSMCVYTHIKPRLRNHRRQWDSRWAAHLPRRAWHSCLSRSNSSQIKTLCLPAADGCLCAGIPSTNVAILHGRQHSVNDGGFHLLCGVFFLLCRTLGLVLCKKLFSANPACFSLAASFVFLRVWNHTELGHYSLGAILLISKMDAKPPTGIYQCCF